MCEDIAGQERCMPITQECIQQNQGMGIVKSKSKRPFVTTNTISLKILPTAPLPIPISESIDCQTETLSNPSRMLSEGERPLTIVNASPPASSYEGSVGSLTSSNNNVSHVNMQGNSGGTVNQSQHITSEVYSNQISAILPPEPNGQPSATVYFPARQGGDIFRTN